MSELPAGRRVSGVIVKGEDVPAEALEHYPLQYQGTHPDLEEVRIYKRDAVRVAEELTGRRVKGIERRNHPNGCILEVKFPKEVLGFRGPRWFEALAKLKGYLDKTNYVRPPRDATPAA